MSKIIAANVDNNNLTIEYSNGTVLEYTKGDYCWTQWKDGEKSEFFVPDTVEFLQMRLAEIKAWKLRKIVMTNANADWAKPIKLNSSGKIVICGTPKTSNDDWLDAFRYGLENTHTYRTLTSGRAFGKTTATQTLTNKTIQVGNQTFNYPTSKKIRLIVWQDYGLHIRKSVDVYKKSGYISWKCPNIHELILSQDQNKLDYQVQRLRGYEFDEILFLNCDESFLPVEVKPQMWRAKLTYAKL